MRRLILLTLVLSLFAGACKLLKKESLEITDLQTEYSVNPIGIDTPKPRFTWILKDTLRNVQQTAYHVLVASKPSLLKPEKADMWNSGWVENSQSVFVQYNGKELQSGKRYYWTVAIKDNKDREVKAENSPFFEMGFLNLADWKASWIGFNPEGLEGEQMASESERPRSILMRKDFNLGSEIKSARAYVSGLGNYVFYVNGEKAGNDLLTPGWTDYNVRVQYQVYDITPLLGKGDNAAGLMLGNMWWSGGLGWQGGQVYSRGPLRAIAQIEIEYRNGEKETIVTDETWKANLSPITDNSLYHGETWDARLEIPLWAEPGLDARGWKNVEKITMDDILLSAQKAPPIRVMDTIVPVSVSEVKPGSFVYDMGQNIVGFARLKVTGNNGDTVKMRFAELLHEDGTVAQENLRSAKATDRYILKGTGEETWQPSFTYHGFRYVQVEGFPGTPTAENLTGLRFYSSAPQIGKFSSSNDMLNRIWKNVMNGQKGNMHSVPTDCPQRDERLGWMGDAQIFAPTASYNLDMDGFFTKWERDITDSQDESGYVFDVNPAIVVGGPSKAGWGDAVTVVPDVVYNFYADKAILEDNYDGMKEWVEYMRKKSKDHIYRWSEKEGDWEGYGDWIAVVKSPVEPISAAYYYYSTKILAKVADILGNSEDNKLYSALADSIAIAFQEKFFDKEKINYPAETQTANILPLVFGITPEEYRDEIAQNIIEDVKERGKHPSTGFLGTSHLLAVLSENGAHQLAYETAINEEYPSWAYMVKNGATTMWELWNSDKEPPEQMNSRNHFALGSVVEWYYAYLGGIKPQAPGFKKILVRPMPAKGLEWVRVDYNTPYGKLVSSWSKDGENFHMDITIPANTAAEVVVPLDEDGYATLSESGKILVESGEITENEDIEVLSVSDKNIHLKVNSGTYAFTLN